MASAVPARKAVKTSQLPRTVGASQTKPTTQEADNDSRQATLFTVAMTAINFVTFLFSLVAVDIHYTLRRSAMGSPAPGMMPRWLHRLLRPGEPYEYYYRTKQKKLMRMEAEEAFGLRSRVLLFLGISALGVIIAVWYLTGMMYRTWVRLVGS